MDLHLYTNRNTVFYFGLSLPTLLMEGIFISIISQANLGLPELAQYLQIVPWVFLIASVFAIATFRPSLLLMLLIVSYFVSSILTSSTSLSGAGYLFGAGEIAALVIVASFCSLISFGYARAAKIEKQKPIISSSGSMRYQALSVMVELLLPSLVAVALVFASLRVVVALTSEAELFPQPLSGIFSNFLISPIITIIIAAITLAVVRDLIEPWILYYTITKEDAVSMMVKEANAMNAGRSRRRIVIAAMIVAIFAVAGLAFAARYFGPGSLSSGGSVVVRTLSSNIGPVFGFGKPTPQPKLWVEINNYYQELENMINAVIRLLWGYV